MGLLHMQKQHVLDASRRDDSKQEREEKALQRELVSRTFPKGWAGLLEGKGYVHLRQSEPYE